MASPHNPFPGMNPFLERDWSDVHTLLIGYIRDALAECRLPEGLRARAEERLSVEEPGEMPGTARGDMAVVEPWRSGERASWPGRPVEGEEVALAEPQLVSREPDTERWVEIRTAGGRLVTVIEVLSPSNKAGQGLARYVAKREAYEHGCVNVVEIDLLRGGAPTVAAESGEAPGDTRYTICVFRAAMPGFYEVYHWGLRDRIPAFAVPLREKDPDAPLDLQPLVNRAYELGYYWQDVQDVTRLDPPLRPEEAAFLGERLRDAGLAGA